MPRHEYAAWQPRVPHLQVDSWPRGVPVDHYDRLTPQTGGAVTPSERTVAQWLPQVMTATAQPG